MDNKQLSIIIMAGGTGGHVYPALAVAQYLVEKEWKVSWIGTKRGMESRVVPAASIEIDWLSVAGIRGKGLFATINNSLILLKSFWQAFRILRARQPDVVLGMGGYVAGPGGLVASILGIPLVIHEQNRVPGTTNTLLMSRAKNVLEAFPDSFAKKINATFVGNPLRSEFMKLPEKKIWSKTSERNFRILVIGGSQGAKIFNVNLPEILIKINNVEIRHQTGKNAFGMVLKKYAVIAQRVQVLEFIEDMASAYLWADMIICRAGAMTVSEVAAAGLPAVFIPLPHAIDDHQTANAKYLTVAGAGILLPQSELNENSLLQGIKKIQDSLKEMSKSAKNKAKLDATEAVASICMEATNEYT